MTVHIDLTLLLVSILLFLAWINTGVLLSIDLMFDYSAKEVGKGRPVDDIKSEEVSREIVLLVEETLILGIVCLLFQPSFALFLFWPFSMPRLRKRLELD